MGIMADRLNNMVVKASSPDGQIQGVYRDRGEIQLTFEGKAYDHYRERGLEHQLSRLALLLWTGYQRGYDDAVTEVMGYPVKDDRQTWDSSRRGFRDEQAKTAASGMSVREYVYVENTGMLNWHFVIRDGTIDHLDQHEFIDECLSAFEVLMDDYRGKMADLRAKHYGISYGRRNRSARNE